PGPLPGHPEVIMANRVIRPHRRDPDDSQGRQYYRPSVADTGNAITSTTEPLAAERVTLWYNPAVVTDYGVGIGISKDDADGLYASKDEFAAVADVPPRVEAVETKVERVAPDNTGTTAQQLRVSVTGPRWRDPDSVSPLDFGAVADGTTDDYSAIMQAYDRLGVRGGKIDLGGKRYRSNQRLVFNGPVQIDGGTAGMSLSRGGEIEFPEGVGGIKFDTDAGFATIRNVKLRGGATGAGTDVGLEVRNGRWTAEKVMITGFGSHGMLVWGDGGAGLGNANVGRASQVRLISNFGDGLHVTGADANCCIFENVATVFNAGIGFYDNAAGKNTYINPLADQNTGVDFYDDGFGNLWLNPYSEGSKNFVIGKGGFGGVIVSGGTLGPPIILAENNVGVLQTNSYWAGQRDWIILDAGRLRDYLRIEGGTQQRKWRFILDAVGNDTMLLQDETSANRMITLYGGASPRVVLEQDTVVASGKRIRFNNTGGPSLLTGAGSPEGVVVAAVGSLYMRTDGAAGATLYVKESGT